MMQIDMSLARIVSEQESILGLNNVMVESSLDDDSQILRASLADLSPQET